VLVAVGWNDTTSSVSSVTDTAGNTYRLAVGPTTLGTSLTQSIYWASNVAATPPTGNQVTVTFNGAARSVDVRILEYSGLDPANPIGQTAAATGNSSTSSVLLVSTTGPSILVAANTVETGTRSAGLGFTARVITTPDGDLVEDRVVAASAPYRASASLISSGGWVMQVVALRMSGASTDVVPPSAPTGLAATPRSASQIDLSWSPSPDAEQVAGYRVERCQGAGCASFAEIGSPAVNAYSDTGLASNTSFSYRVRAFDTAGNQGPYSSVVTASTGSPPDTTPPSVSITSPAPHTGLSGTVTIDVGASDSGSGVASVSLLLDGNPVGSPRTAAPYTFTLDTASFPNGSHSLGASARDGAGNVGMASTVPVTFNNGGPPPPPPPVAFPLSASANRRYLQDSNGTPFPIFGRTAWFLTSLSSNEYQAFVDDSTSKGYDAVEFHVVNHDARGNNPPWSGNRELPFSRRLDGSAWDGSLSYGNPDTDAPDFTQPNEAYWSHVDGLLAYLESNGVLAFMFPAYVGYRGSGQGWMVEVLANGPARMNAYGAWLARRYSGRKNIVWMMGGDDGTFPLTFDPSQQAAENALIAGIKGVPNPPTLFSAEWNTESIASDQTQLGTQMTVDGAYSWTGDVSTQTRRAYAYAPVEPSFLLEEPYDEEGPDGNNFNPNATQPVRRFLWKGMLGAIGGYVAGNGYVWSFNPGWRGHLTTQGSRDLTRLHAFFRSIAWQTLVPSGLGGMKTLITGGGGSPSDPGYVAAAAAPDGTTLVAYVPPAHSGNLTVDMTAMSVPTRARWFDPTTAAYSTIGTNLPASGTRPFTPPGPNGAGDTDWVLVLDRSP
jgi:hypothetical protein